MDAKRWLCEGSMVAGVGNLPWERTLGASGPSPSAEQTNKRTVPQSKNQSKGAGKRPPASLLLPRSSLCDNHCGFIFHRDKQKREREYQRLEFSFTSMVVFSLRLL